MANSQEKAEKLIRVDLGNLKAEDLTIAEMKTLLRATTLPMQSLAAKISLGWTPKKGQTWTLSATKILRKKRPKT